MEYPGNMIGRDIDQDDFDIIKEYTESNRLSGEWLPICTYDMVQGGWPRPDHGMMVARPWGGLDGENKLLPGDGMWMKVDDVKLYISYLHYCCKNHVINTLTLPTFEEFKKSEEER